MNNTGNEVDVTKSGRLPFSRGSPASRAARARPMSDDEIEYEETPWCSDDDDESSASRPPSPRAAYSTGKLRDGRRFAAIFCSPKRKPLEYHAEAEQMLEAGVLDCGADLSQGATLATLEALMKEVDPHILWFVGHGDAMLSGKKTLCWSTKSGDIQLLDPSTCADLLLRHIPTRGGSLECIVTNSCCTASDSTTICALLHAGGLPVAIGWSSKVHDDAGPSFALGFLRGLQHGSFFFFFSCSLFSDVFRSACMHLPTLPAVQHNTCPPH